MIVANSDPTNYTAFASNAAGALACLAAGNCHQAGYDILRGDPFFQMDMRVAKNIRLREGWNLQLIFQAFNLTNKVNFGNDFHNTAGAPAFLTPEGYINPASSTIPRAFIGEFGARFTF